MVIILLTFLLISNAVSLRRDQSILFSRIVIKSLLFATGLSTNTFNTFALLISAIILILTGFYPRRANISFTLSSLKLLTAYNSICSNKWILLLISLSIFMKLTLTAITSSWPFLYYLLLIYIIVCFIMMYITYGKGFFTAREVVGRLMFALVLLFFFKIFLYISLPYLVYFIGENLKAVTQVIEIISALFAVFFYNDELFIEGPRSFFESVISRIVLFMNDQNDNNSDKDKNYTGKGKGRATDNNHTGKGRATDEDFSSTTFSVEQLLQFLDHRDKELELSPDLDETRKNQILRKLLAGHNKDLKLKLDAKLKVLVSEEAVRNYFSGQHSNSGEGSSIQAESSSQSSFIARTALALIEAISSPVQGGSSPVQDESSPVQNASPAPVQAESSLVRAGSPHPVRVGSPPRGPSAVEPGAFSSGREFHNIHPGALVTQAGPSNSHVLPRPHATHPLISRLTVFDPLNQVVTGYNTRGTNQPYARNLASALYNPFQDNRMLASITFDDPGTTRWLLGYLYHNKRAIYNRITNNGQNPNPLLTVRNTENFREDLWNLD